MPRVNGKQHGLGLNIGCFDTLASLRLTNIKHYLNLTLPWRRKAQDDDGDKDGAGCEIVSLKR